MPSTGQCTYGERRTPGGAPGGLCPVYLMTRGLVEAARAEIPPPSAGGPSSDGTAVTALLGPACTLLHKRFRDPARKTNAAIDEHRQGHAFAQRRQASGGEA